MSTGAGSAAEFSARLSRARTAAAAAGLDAVLVTPGPDLRYLTGYVAKPLERLTCLVVPADADPVLIVPFLERPAAEAAGVAAVGLAIADWQETDDPIALVAGILGPDVRNYGVDDHMWAEKVLRLRAGMPEVEQRLAGGVLRDLRIRKTDAEIEALREAGAAIDRVHRRIGEWLRPGRTEREIGRDIADAIVAEGHVRADFVIVGSGPNGASPHHDVSDRVVEPGDVVVVDIGGTTEAGYCSDSTRTYAVGEPDPDFRRYYAVLLEAQIAACDAVRPGISAQQVDRVARGVIEAAGYGEFFVHRTGHGIGLEGHEHPYIVEGNAETLQPGMAFSVEPGIYLPARHGARIEDIVVCTAAGGERLNLTPRELQVLPA
ncbi:MAG TPA: Xaa-Pro peptidase family protein [Sporichthyaceae bacterium]|nr:Xaa-Pro peptidase family protein [Sporichthyaceae bacterium]